jgi:hypothetical protein
MRRLVFAAAALALLAAPARAPAPPAGAPPQMAPPQPPPRPHHVPLRQRFEAANTTHDGKLTRDQAAAADWPNVLNHFDEIDRTNRGYVTVQDIRGYFRARRAAMHPRPAPQGEPPMQPGAPPAPMPPPATNG